MGYKSSRVETEGITMLTEIELDELTCQIDYINRMWDIQGISVDAGTLQSLTQPVRFARGGSSAEKNPVLQIYTRSFTTQGKDLFIDMAVALAAWSSEHPHSIKYPMGGVRRINTETFDINNVRYSFQYDVLADSVLSRIDFLYYDTDPIINSDTIDRQKRLGKPVGIPNHRFLRKNRLNRGTKYD